MKVCYVAGPFRGKNAWEIHRNVLDAESVIPYLIRQGYAPICPHKMTENLQGLFPDKVYLDICLELLRRCDAIYMLQGWENSEGSREELAEAKRLGLEILYE